ncbi:MKI67 FHA domain-interacting nucleolar phosphoprotein [Wyeomyia smithii]|uniref:MKI67 FHA domain-interacting nucleolar phosphoprotein n=1 Tax=Wyeomyia smithii TaxID=174621 RepID=UPI0024681582|nr:MKI67 FHA domain-interacting nucleolar phosphoprotein [Wyeomyia smithii]
MPAVAKSSRKPKAKSPKKPLLLSAQGAHKAAKKPEERNEKGIIYIKHLPHGFFENQLRTFFAQFGDVTRVHVARSKKTLRSRGYAYVEFRYREVAQIAAETMNNYLMFGKILKTGILPAGAKRIPRKYEKAFDKNGNETTTYKIWLKRMVARSNGRVTKTKIVNRNNKALAKLKKLEKKYTEMGVDYDVTAVRPAFAESDITKPEHDPEEERSKTKKKKSTEQKKADSLETFLKNVKPQESEQDSSDEDQDACFVALERDDWDAPESSDDDDEDEKPPNKSRNKAAALKRATKTKHTLIKEKKNTLQKLSKSAPEPVVTKEKKSTKKSSKTAHPKVAQEKVVPKKDKPSTGRVTKPSKVKPKKQPSKEQANSPLKKVATALLQDPSVKKVKAKDVKKKPKVK